ncbi:MAG: PAS domain-containing sensor histidine kinase [Sphingobacteriales bacterium]|nr:MAG: PAS domain-containing sensor histidine kinase [Sphingobacteriales bacterium]
MEGLTMTDSGNLLLDSIRDAVIMLDKDGFVGYANPAVTEIAGYTQQEMINKPLSILYEAKEDLIKAEYELEQARKKGKFISEGWKSKKNGDLFWGELTIAAIHDNEHQHSGYSCLLRDTSARKQTETSLRQSEEHYRLMVETIRDYSIFMLDCTGHVLTWNDGAKRNSGYTSTEIIGKHFSTFYTTEDLGDGKPERELRIAIETGKYEEEGWRVKKNGSIYWASVIITALFNEQNRHIGFSKVVRDLTERKENDERLRQSEERYRSLVEQVTDYGIFILDEKGRIASWNEGAKRIKGYTADEVIGKYFSIFYPEEDIMNGKPAHELKVAIAEGKYEEEGWRLRKDGTRFWANVVITAVYNTSGVLIGFSKVTKDLTERKENERALKQSHDRYRRLADELKITNEELSYTNREMEQFTSIVSHDLQEPIRTIKSFLLLIDMKLDAEQNKDLKVYIGKSIGAANRMRELIQNLLHYSQLGKDELITEDVNVNMLISQAMQNLRSSIESSGAKILIENDLETVPGDKVQLGQLIQNLLGNALKFTSDTEPYIKITAHKEDNHVKFAISDNGIGIAREDLHKVFEIFRRLNTEKTYPGTGIGLAICKKIVDRHKGKIWPESEKGKGTTFYFTLNEN